MSLSLTLYSITLSLTLTSSNCWLLHNWNHFLFKNTPAVVFSCLVEAYCSSLMTFGYVYDRNVALRYSVLLFNTFVLYIWCYLDQVYYIMNSEFFFSKGCSFTDVSLFVFFLDDVCKADIKQQGSRGSTAHSCRWFRRLPKLSLNTLWFYWYIFMYFRFI